MIGIIFCIVLIFFIIFITKTAKKESGAPPLGKPNISDTTDNQSDTLEKNKMHFPDMRPNVYYQYSIDRMAFYFFGKCGDADYADFYFVSPEYYKKVINELTLINLLLQKAHSEYPKIPLMRYNPSSLKFERFSEYSNMFTMFRHHPVTYKSKDNENPYSISIRFGDEDNSFFDVYYNKFGYVNKVRLICWQGKTLYVMNARVYNKELQIVSAYKKIGIDEERIFDIDYELRQIRKSEYQWICENFPELAPKSLSAYTRAKNSKTEKYLKLEKEAFKKGKILNNGIL